MSDRPPIIYLVRGYPVRTREEFEQVKRDVEPYRQAGEQALKALRRAKYV